MADGFVLDSSGQVSLRRWPYMRSQVASKMVAVVSDYGCASWIVSPDARR